MSETGVATWDISLDTDCPSCDQYVDLLDFEDFWDGKAFQAVEHETPATRGVEVVCPECGYEFKVDFAY